ncbi:hypothetical protein PMAYCL1PPCAC_11718, partial [Pristionchus mayeri]
MKSILLSLLFVAAAAASAVDDMIYTIQVNEGPKIKLPTPWGLDIPGGKIHEIVFTKHLLDMSPDKIEVSVDESGLTSLKVANLPFEWDGDTNGKLALVVPISHSVKAYGTIDGYEKKYSNDAPWEVEDGCTLPMSKKSAKVEGKFSGMVEDMVINGMPAVMCRHIYFFGRIIAEAVKEVGVANLKHKSGKGAAGIK